MVEDQLTPNQRMWRSLVPQAAQGGWIDWRRSKKSPAPPVEPCEFTGWTPDAEVGYVEAGTGDLVLRGGGLGAKECRLKSRARAAAFEVIDLGELGLPCARRFIWQRALGLLPSGLTWNVRELTLDEECVVAILKEERLYSPQEVRGLLLQMEIQAAEEAAEAAAEEERLAAEAKARKEEVLEFFTGMPLDPWGLMASDLSAEEIQRRLRAASLLQKGTEEALLEARSLWED